MARPAVSSSDSLFYYRHRTRRRLIAFVRFVIVFYVIYQIVTIMLVSSFSVASRAMSPGVLPGDRLLVAPVVYGARVPFTELRLPPIRGPRRGDMVLVRPPFARIDPWYLRLANPVVEFFTGQTAGVGGDARQDAGNTLTLERIVGIPGDTVEVRGGTVYIKPQGAAAFSSEQEVIRGGYRLTPLSLPKGWSSHLPFSGNVAATTLAPHQYFVMDDDRGMASDSASWGPIPSSRFVGMVIFRYWPLAAIGPL